MGEEVNKEAIMEQQLQNIERYIGFNTAEEAIASLGTEEKFLFLTDYYTSENLDYDVELKKKLAEGQDFILKEKAKITSKDYSKELIMAVLSYCKIIAISSIVDEVTEIHKTLRQKLKQYKITDFNATMTYQLATGNIAMKYNSILSQEVKKECEDKGIDFEKFMSLALPFLTNDFSVFFEIDGYVSLKAYKESKNKKITREDVLSCSKKTIEYSKLLLEEKIPPQSVMIFPNMMNQFLIMETGFDNYQVIGQIVKELEADDKEKYLDFFNHILEEIWYVERCRGLIFYMFKQQMEAMEEMAKGMPAPQPGMENLMQGSPETQMGGQAFPPGMPPSDGGMPPGMPPGMPDMEKLKEAMENMDVEMLEKIMPMGDMANQFNPKP